MTAEHKGFLAKLFSPRSENERHREEKTIFKVKTVSDIPPIIEARRLIGDYKVEYYAAGDIRW